MMDEVEIIEIILNRVVKMKNNFGYILFFLLIVRSDFYYKYFYLIL
jgi:hypothetical protein